METFETQFEDLDVATNVLESATANTTAVATPQDDVDRLISKVADEAGLELADDMKEAPTKTPATTMEEQEDGLGERLRALRAA